LPKPKRNKRPGNRQGGFHPSPPPEVVDQIINLASVGGSNAEIYNDLKKPPFNYELSKQTIARYALSTRVENGIYMKPGSNHLHQDLRQKIHDLTWNDGKGRTRSAVQAITGHGWDTLRKYDGVARQALKETPSVSRMVPIPETVKEEPQLISTHVAPIPLELGQLVTVFQNALDKINVVQVTIDNLKPSIVQGLQAAQNLVNTEVMMSELQLLRVGIDIASVAVETQEVLQQSKVGRIAGNLFTQQDEEAQQRTREILEKAYSDANLSEKSLNQGA